ncbi:hypothetical protein, partial [Micromonospora sp. NPDC005174]|uniref:hypothetical protein n=1 Tax=Micromonospora sp. NPDC005174 TaxID=3157018 RepID=UPI0033BDA1B5
MLAQITAFPTALRRIGDSPRSAPRSAWVRASGWSAAVAAAEPPTAATVRYWRSAVSRALGSCAHGPVHLNI